jgi:rhamnogalacturonyl hydrolase YesR
VESQWAEARNAQLMALEVPNTAMAVAIDAGEWNDVHPENKQVIGERLALAARSVAYGEEDLVYSGPVLDAVAAEDGRLLLTFRHAGSGLEARGGPLRGFAVAGAAGAFEWAQAEIRGDDRIVVWCDAVPRPLRVRYAWADNPESANLYNREGLPASPFEAQLPGGVADPTPAAVGEGLVRDLLGRDDFMWYDIQEFSGLHYAEINTAFGALRFLERTGDREALQRVLARYDDVPGLDALAVAGHVDASVYGILPLQAYLLTGQERQLERGLRFADRQWADPRPDGLSRETRFWIDDVWMVNSLQVQAYRATRDPVYLDRAALQTEAYLERLQQANGLFHHGEGSPFFWGRGNGWVAAGLAELLTVLPADHPRYRVIVAGYRQMMEALLRYQAPGGMWRQLVNDPEAWGESSGTAMFGYAMAVGVRQGLLPADPYRAAYRKAWSALAEHLDADGRLTEICVGTGKGTDRQYYLDRPRETGDFHGHAPLLWFAFELLAQ